MKRDVVSRKADPVEKSTQQHPVQAPFQPFQPGGWLSFSYTHGEISHVDGKTQVRTEECRFENGKLEFDTFAGTLDGSVYREAVERAQKVMLAQSAFVLGLFQAFLPPPDRK
jgi:hypothetical protein